MHEWFPSATKHYTCGVAYHGSYCLLIVKSLMNPHNNYLLWSSFQTLMNVQMEHICVVRMQTVKTRWDPIDACAKKGILEMAWFVQVSLYGSFFSITCNSTFITSTD